MIHLIRHAVDERFFRSSHLDLLLVAEDPDAILDQLTHFNPPPAGPVWLDLEQT